MPPIDFGAAGLAAAAAHVMDCMKMYSMVPDVGKQYWSDTLPEVEDGKLKIQLEIPVEEAYFWWQANSRMAAETFLSPSQWKSRISEKSSG